MRRKDDSLFQSYVKACISSPLLACQRGNSSNPLVCPLEVPHTTGKQLDSGLASSREPLPLPVGVAGQQPSLLGLPEPIIQITNSFPPGLTPHVDINYVNPFSASDLKMKRAASASDARTPHQPKSPSLDRSTLGKLFSYRRSLRLAAKNLGVHKNSIGVHKNSI